MDSNMHNMRDRHNAQNPSKPEIPAQCHFCGSETAILYAAATEQLWVQWRPIYATELRRFLCANCRKMYSPAMSLSLDSGKNELLRVLPLFDETSGNVLPLVLERQLKAHPFYFTPQTLAEQQIVATLLEIQEISDAIILKLVPWQDQETYMDNYRENPGFIFTSVSRHQSLPEINLPTDVLFTLTIASHVRMEWVYKQQYHSWVF